MTLIVCAGKNEDFRFAKSIGVGLVEASAGLCELLFKFNVLGAGAKRRGETNGRKGVAGEYSGAKSVCGVAGKCGVTDGLISGQSIVSELNEASKPDKIIFIGTCGLYQKGDEKDLNAVNLSENGKIKENLGAKNLASEKPLKLLEIYESAHCFNVEASKLTNDFYSPAECEINLNVSYETKKCNSSNYICTDENLAARFADLGLELENMESFAVLSVAKRFGISATCFLCATNFCDKNAHQSFLQNHAQAKKNLEHFLQEKNLI